MGVVLYLDDVFDFSNIGVDSFDDTKLLNDIMLYIEEGCYDLVVFPYNKTFLVKPSSTKEFAIEIPSDVCIDFNKCILKIDDAYDDAPCYTTIKFKQRCQNTTLKNGTILGNRYLSNLQNVPHSENAITIKLNGRNNKLVNMTIKDCMGDGIVIDGDLIKSNRVKSDIFTNGELSTGIFRESEYALCTDYLEFDKYFKMGYGILIDTTYISTCNTKENGLYIDSHIMRVYFYDENKTKITQRTCSAFEGISSDLIPTNTKYFRVVLMSHVKLQGFNGNLYFFSYDFAEKCEIINCTVNNSRRNGITVGASIDCEIKNNRIINTNGKTPQRGIDVEPEWGGCSGLAITANTFCGNIAGSLACIKCRNLKITKNRMYEGLSITRCIYFEFSDNIITDFVSISLNSPVTTNLEQPMSIIKNNRFVASEYEVNTYLMFTNVLVKDNFFYNVNSLLSKNDISKVIGNVIHLTGVNRKSFVCRTSHIANNIIKAENKNITLETPMICDNTFVCSSITLSPPFSFTTDIYNMRLNMTGNIFNISGLNGVIFKNLPYTIMDISDNIVTFTSSGKTLSFIKGNIYGDSTLFICKNIFNKECNIFNTSTNEGIITTDENYFKKGTNE